jgi:hypothetical protein
MEPTTVTTIVLVIFGVVVLALSIYNLFGDWQPQVRQVSREDSVEAEYQAAVRELRKAIRQYERGH